MKRMILVIGLCVSLATLVAAQNRSGATYSDLKPANEQMVRITNGPGVDHLTDTSAEVFWNTTAKSDSLLRYGTDRERLSETAEGQSGQADHKVELNNLKPDTTYFFEVVASNGQSLQKNGVGVFKTKPASATKHSTPASR
jgi:phosphodiesterase/alkaline phosphatase D-like protein